MNRHPAPRHRHGHHPRPRRPRHHDVYAARRRGQTLAMLAVAGLGLVLLIGLVALVESGRDSSRHGGALLEEPWK